MNIFAKSTIAKKPRTIESQKISYLYAVILIIFALAQLFTFDKFLVLIESFRLPGGEIVAHILGSIIVSSEVLALPFLLGIKLNPLMRVISMVLGWFVPLIWLRLALWLIFTNNPVSNIGLLGATLSLIPGWWVVFVSIALGMLAAWASWGLWPGKRE